MLKRFKSKVMCGDIDYSDCFNSSEESEKLNIFKQQLNNKDLKLDSVPEGLKNRPVTNLPHKRIKQQQGLSMFGDKDRDGIINALDANPRNKNIQGGMFKKNMNHMFKKNTQRKKSNVGRFFR